MSKTPVQALLDELRARSRAVGRDLRAHPLQAAALLLFFAFAGLPLLEPAGAPQDQWRMFNHSAAEIPHPLARLVVACTRLPDFYFQTGRPLVWIAEAIEFSGVTRLADLGPLRYLGGLALAPLSWVLCAILRPRFLVAAWVPFVAALVLTVPALTFMTTQGLTGLPVVASFVLGWVAWWSWADPVDPGESADERPGCGRCGLSVLAFLVGCGVYPTTAFSWTLLAAMDLVSRPLSEDASSRLHRRQMEGLFLFGASTLAYFLGTKIWVLIWTSGLGYARIPLRQYTMSLELSPLGLLGDLGDWWARGFWATPCVVGTAPSAPLRSLGLVVALAVLGRPLAQQAHRRSEIFGRVGWALFMLSLGGAPWIFSRYETLHFRHTAVLQAAWILGGGLVLDRLSQPAAAEGRKAPLVHCLVALGMVGATGWIHGFHSAGFRAFSAEFRFVKEAVRRGLEAEGLAVLRRVHFIRPSPAWTMDGRERTHLGETHLPVHAGNAEHATQMLFAVLRELVPRDELSQLSFSDCRFNLECRGRAEALSRDVIVTSSEAGEPLPQTVTLLVDVHAFQARAVEAAVRSTGH